MECVLCKVQESTFAHPYDFCTTCWVEWWCEEFMIDEIDKMVEDIVEIYQE